MDYFNSLVSNELFSEKEDYAGNSEFFHRVAIYHLEKKLTADPKCVASLCDWIASYHELALLYQHQGALEKAQKCLLIPHQSMLNMLHNNQGDEELKLIASRAIALTLPPLMEFAEIHPPCDSCMQMLRAQLSWLENKTETYH